MYIHNIEAVFLQEIIYYYYHSIIAIIIIYKTYCAGD